MKQKWTGERLESFIFTRDTIDHLHRYALSCNYVSGKTVLDIASGEGYGSNILSKTATKVYGVDIDATTIANAKIKYQAENLEFLVGNTSEIPLETNSVDIVISFETIEHHEFHDEMMQEIKRVLRPEGVMIISTPDKLEYTDKRLFNNQYHIKELYKEEFQNLISNYFKDYQLLSQTYVNGNSFIDELKEEQVNKVYSGSYDEILVNDCPHMYLIAIASDFKIQKQEFSIFDGSRILSENINLAKKSVYDSNSYRIGHLILSPLKLLKKIFK